MIKYAGDTIIYFAHKDVSLIEKCLNEDMECISTYCLENELILNTKKGKTEVMLFGTSKRLKSSGKELAITYNGVPINFVTQYKYLGIIDDDNLAMSDNFNRSYRRASSRLRLLERMKLFITLKTCNSLCFECCFTIDIQLSYTFSFSNTQIGRFESLDRRAKAILPIGTLPSIYNQLKQECVVLVKKCLNSELGCEIFNTYFDITAHAMNKRNNFSSIKLPPVKLEVARRGFYFAGGTLYNSLTLYIRDITNTLDFKKSVSTFFS